MSEHGSEELAQKVRGPVLVPGDEGYEEETQGTQIGVPLRPAVIVGALDAEDVRAAVGFAAARKLPVRVHSTGHGLQGAFEGGLLISTRRMNEVHVDVEARTVRAGGGARWGQVTAAAAPHGLAPLNGSAPHSGVTGYTLGGGAGIMGRTFGYTADHVHSIELVTPDGTLREVSATEDPDLFWALRGGRDGFGVVTAMEIDLVPVERVYGGALFYDATQARELLTVYRDWTTDLSEELTSSISFVALPDIPPVPEPLRGRHVAHVRILFTGDPAEGERLVAPLRELGPPLLGGLQEMPYTETPAIYNDPEGSSAFSGTNLLLESLDPEETAKIVAAAGPGAPFFSFVQLNHLGGAHSRASGDGNAVGHREAQFALCLGSVAPKDLDMDAAAAFHRELLGPSEGRKLGRFLNFLGGQLDTGEIRDAYEPETWERLTAIRKRVDPDGRFGAPATRLD